MLPADPVAARLANQTAPPVIAFSAIPAATPDVTPAADLYHQKNHMFKGLQSEEDKVNLLCELNVVRQVYNLCHTSIVQDAWARGQKLAGHGWVYGLSDGKVNNLNVTVNELSQLNEVYRLDLE